MGMSRSGTKLLRDVLNNNKDVSIPYYESHLVPYLIKNFPQEKFPLDKNSKKELIKLVKSSIFYNEIKNESEGFKDLDFDKLTDQKNIQESIKYLMSKLANPISKERVKIWGDKTPNYLFNIKMLKTAFPKAKFIHIIRDPRERALSSKKAWNASLLMSAMRWHQGVGSARDQGRSIGHDYIEVTYEALVSDPQKQIKKICTFLGINYSKSMLYLSKPAENYGTADSATRSAKTIISNNVSKFNTQLPPKNVKKIEAICGDLAIQLGYTKKKSKQNYRINKIEEIFLKTKDKLMTTLFHIRRWGLYQGIKYLLWRRKVYKFNPEQ